MRACHRCGRETGGEGRVGRTEECPGCGADLHACLNCRFHDSGASNECREPRAERVVEKDRANFCDFFLFREAPGPGKRGEPGDLARRRLEDLFKKT